tara:strand:- start:545 stop:760 length:216 start_codon:yes stop_codon:yes gene_type:complete
MGRYKNNGMSDRRYSSSGKWTAYSRWQWKIILYFAAAAFVLYQLDSCGFIDLDENSGETTVEDWDATKYDW